MVPEEISVPLDYIFDWGNFVVEEPETHMFNKGGSTVELTTSKVYVLGDNSEKLQIYFEVAEQNIFGINGIWPIRTIEYEQSRKNIEGFQICYPLTSLSTINNPTPAEIATRHTFNMMWETTVDALKKFCEKRKKHRKVPSLTYNAYIACREDEDWSYAVKPLYDYRTTVN